MLDGTHDITRIIFTQFKSSGAPLSKRFYLNEGVIKKQAAAQMTKGTADRVNMTLKQFADALQSADDRQAFGYGVHDLAFPDKVSIAVAGKEKPEQNVISRTKGYFAYRKQPGILMLDHDPSEYGPSLSPDELIKAIAAIHPGIEKAARIVRGSVSAGVHIDGGAPGKGKGFHVYIPVANAADIPRYGKLLFDRLWLAGFGFIALARNGALLERSVIDSAVFSPERLDFVGRPVISGLGLQYIPPEISFTEGGLLDTESLTDVTDDERSTLELLISEKKSAIKPQSTDRRNAWATDRVAQMQAQGSTLEEAHAVVDSVLRGECRDLYDGFILEFPLASVSVRDVLANGAQYDGKALADPIEGPDYGTTTAKFFWNKGVKPCINSHAHGGMQYFLHAADATKDSRIDSLEACRKQLDANAEFFNEAHASVVIGGKHKVMRWIPAEDTAGGRAFYEFFDREALNRLHDNEQILIGYDARGHAKYSNRFMAWAKHPKARTYKHGVVFAPGGKVGKDYFNTWRGFSVAPRQNDELLAPINAHINDVVCAGNRPLSDYLLKWIAYTFQNPDKPAGAAIVLRGGKGSGKGTLGHFLRSLWGNHGLHVANAKHLVGNFNAHLADTCFLFADEAFYSGDKQHEGVLKALITEPTLTIERKGIDAVTQPNYLKILMATNAEYAVPATRDERRYFVADVSGARIGDREYFTTLHTAIKSEAVQAAFLYAMLNMDLSGFHPGDIPESAGLRVQRYHSLASEAKWLADCLGRGSFGEDIGEGGFPAQVHSTDLYAHYIAWCDAGRLGEYSRRSHTMFGSYLSKLYRKVRTGAGRIQYVFGSLADARACFESVEGILLDELNPSTLR